MKETIKVGDTVRVAPNFGRDTPVRKKVTFLGITNHPRCKYCAEQVEEVSMWLVEENKVLFEFEDNTWAYSEQIQGA